MTYITTYKDLTRIVICGKKEVENYARIWGRVRRNPIKITIRWRIIE